MAIFADLDPDAPVVVAELVWQYSHHVLAGLISHRGSILTVANWSGEAPGLVGMLNLNGSLTKAGFKYSTLWSETFEDDYFRQKLSDWPATGTCHHETVQVAALDPETLPADAVKVGREIAAHLRRHKSIMGVFDEGGMGIFNAIIPDARLFPCGVFKERLSQSALYYATTQVTDAESRAVY
jgi:hypothetical protein